MKAFILISIMVVMQTLLSAETPEQTGVSASQPITLLFAGSSSTYWNDFPREAAKIVDGQFIGHVGAKVIPEIVGRSGSDIRVYAEPGFNKYEYGVKPGQSFLDKIRDEKPPFVVLQTVCRFIMGDDDPTGTGNAHAEAVTKYCEAIRAAGGEPIFFEMGWGKSEREDEGRKRLFDLAVKNKIKLFAPCSTAWARVYREKPELVLQHPKDSSHPGDIGHFLNLACFYAALTGESPVGKLPRTYPVWPHALPKAETDVGKADEAARIGAFKPDAYQSKMPKWMFKNMSMKLTATVDEATAKYLETVAWETWQHVTQTLLSVQSKAQAKESGLHNSPRQAGSLTRQTGVSVPHFLSVHCLDCHDSDAKKGGLDLSRFTDEAAVMKDRGIWRGVYEKVESHQMPPPKQKSQPTEAERQELMTWIMDIAARPDPALGAPDPGKPVLRHLTRLEYNNTIRDLFDLPLDVFMFSERLPIDHKHFDPTAKTMGERLQVPVREPGLKYAVLLPEAGMPGDNRAEHGFTNRGEAMNLSPLLLERYLDTARAITHSPKLPMLSASFAAMIADPRVPRRAMAVPSGGDGQGITTDAAPDFAPNFNVPDEARDGDLMMTTYQHRFGVRAGVAEGIAGVWDANARSQIWNAGKRLGVRFGLNHEKTLVLTPHEDVWIAGFSTATETSGESLFTNHTKDAKQLQFDLHVEGGAEGEGVVEAGVCALSRKGESGIIAITATFTDGSTASLKHAMKKGEGIGNTFFGFRAQPGKHIIALSFDGRGFSGNYALFDDLGFITGQMPVAKAVASETNRMSDRAVRKLARVRLTAFATKAFRRGVADSELDRFVDVFEAAQKQSNSFEEGMKESIAAILTSPDFLYLSAVGTGKQNVRPLTGDELATRLAYFLWAAPPDEPLRAAAASGGLQSYPQVHEQVLRMIRDPRVRELGESFAVQWLRLDQLTTAKPDPKLFKAFYSGPQNKTTLHGSMLVEALLLFETTLVEDRSILDFIQADYTWLNPGLARLYNFESLLPDGASKKKAGDDSTLVTAKSDSQWFRVKLPKDSRGGFITMAGPLTVTSLPVRTSPVKRGAWLLETIFNRPPQEPKVAFVLKDDDAAINTSQSVRQRFEAHRNKDACFSCNVRLDPPGFALERFDAIGRWRDSDAGQPVDARGVWSGAAFDGPSEYKALLAKNPHEFVRGFIEHLLSYALSRELEVYDMPVVDYIEHAAQNQGYKLSVILAEIAKSYPFTHVKQTLLSVPDK